MRESSGALCGLCAFRVDRGVESCYDFLMIYEPGPGVHIYHAAQEAVVLAKLNREDVDFVFNGTKGSATPFSHPDDVVTIWELRRAVDNLRRRLGENARFTAE